MIIFKLIKESLRLAIDALVSNKLRTILSLLGITIGIFAMISVFAVVDSLERQIRENIESLGSDIIYIQKFSWDWENEPWWKVNRRPHPDLNEYRMVKRLSNAAETVAMNVNGNGQLKYKNNNIGNVSMEGITHEYDDIWNLDIQNGRYFTELESRAGRPVVIIGYDIAENLFSGENPIGKSVKFKDRKLTVIGVLAREGESLFGNSNDNKILMPITMAANFYRLNRYSSDLSIMVKAKEGISNEQLIDELRSIMRSLRKLKPHAEDNFALNQMSMITNDIEQMFSAIHLAGFIIGIFSIIVGGFSIANIMFVSVKERTSIIGIQKSIGAKNYFILFQFLFESIFLCLIGGSFGLLLIYIGTLISNQNVDFQISMSLENVIMGLGISVTIGIISGIVPAWNASQLDPVEAIRTN